MNRLRTGALLCALSVVSCATARPTSPLETDGLPLLGLPAVGRVDFDAGALSGKVVLVQFFATWCFTCLTDLPNLEALQKHYGPKGFQSVLVGMDLEGKAVLEPFAYKFDLPIPILVADAHFIRGDSRFGHVEALPSNFLFGRDGRLAAAWSGIALPALVDERVSELVR